jgi:site-specific DNA-methyltransferase (adenine-specific)
MIDTIICGDCIEIMREIQDEYIDLVVTDPPYGMSFMGKAWDKALPSVNVWRECLRVLKPGAFAFVMCIPRQDCLSRMIINLEDAGFMVNFSPIYHTFATGFPKAANLSKLADKRAGAEREVIGKRFEGGMNRKNAINMQHGYRPNDYKKDPEIDITLSATREAKALEGAYAGLQMKPAVEVVLCAMKPLSEKTYLDQALSNGKGCSWLDDGRIPYEQGDDAFEKGEERSKYPRADIRGGNFRVGITSEKTHMVPNGMSQNGRFAPNLLVSDDVLNDGRRTRSTGGNTTRAKDNKIGSWGHGDFHMQGYGDSGSYSRYFSLDAWAAKNLPESAQKTFPFFIVPKASKSEKNAGLDGLEEKVAGIGDDRPGGQSYQRLDGGPTRTAKNNHPTVKPIKLMSYLIAIGSRPGDIVLDPYAGSGTTGMAAALLDRRYTLIEMDAEYCDIAERRIAWYIEQRIAAEQAQLKLDI